MQYVCTQENRLGFRKIQKLGYAFNRLLMFFYYEFAGGNVTQD